MLNLLLGIGRHCSLGKWKLHLTSGYGHIGVGDVPGGAQSYKRD